MFEKGLVICHPRCGVLAVPRSELTSMQFYDGVKAAFGAGVLSQTVYGVGRVFF